MKNAKRVFSPEVKAKLGYYIYLYLHPETGDIFYVGKGKGNRVFAHLNDESDCEKVRIIRDLRDRSLEPRIEILTHGLPDEQTALRVEAAVIDLIGLRHLANKVHGCQSGLYGRMPVDVLESLYAQEPVTITHRVVLIRINQLFYEDMSEVALYEATRGFWVMNPEWHNPEYAFSVFDGIVREVYRIKAWHKGGTTPYTTREWHGVAPNRREFTGVVAEEEVRSRYLLKSVRGVITPNAQNPISYVNC